MGPWGALVMSFFGAGFATWASVLLAGWASPTLALGPLVFLAVAVVASLKIRRTAKGAYSPSPGAARVMSLSSAAEGVAIPIVALTLANTGHAKATLPGIALVVGLHFLPMAWAIPFRFFYVLAAVLIMTACAGFLFSQPGGSILVGYVAALTLWIASVLALRRGPRATRGV